MHRVLPSSNHSSATGPQDVHPLDSLCCCLDHEPRLYYVYVGDNKGRYQVNGQGEYYYVGPHAGPYEQEELPPDHSQRCACICFLLLLLAMLLVYVLRHMTFDPLFDCTAGVHNLEAGWSDMKRRYCCDDEGIACYSGEGTTIQPRFHTGGLAPAWLNEWLPEMSIGNKFIMSGMLFLSAGCFVGCCILYICLRYFLSDAPGDTEEELHSKMHEHRERDGGEADGEIVITMMWDTKDDLDLQLELPDERGTLSHAVPELAGGTMDINRNNMGKDAKFPAVENIFWEPFCPYSSMNPPNGEYNLWVKVLYKRESTKDTNITIYRQVAGRTKFYHRRIPPGTRDLHVDSFVYHQPRGLTEKEQSMIRTHKLFQTDHGFQKALLNVSMVWDTSDVIELQLKQPKHHGTRFSQDGSGDTLHDQSRCYINIKAPVEGIYEMRAHVTEKLVDEDTYVTVVVNMNGKRKVFHHRIEGESLVYVGAFHYKKK